MKPFFCLLTLLLIGFSGAAKKKSHKAHVHGEGKFTLAVEGHDLEIAMEIPSHDIVGFEHKPKTKKQKQAVREAEKILKKVDQVVVLPEKSACKAVKVKVETPFEKEEHGHHHHGHEEETHSEFHMSYKFRCNAPKFMSRVTLALFGSFPSLKELKGQAVTMEGQFSKELTPAQSTFMLKK